MAVPRPSSSIVLLSPYNEVLLLQRVNTSTSFASAHVFPGGNVDAFHDGDVPDKDDPARHQDGPQYRMAAVRECFEETGILLARRKDGESGLLEVGSGERDEARRRIHGSQINFGDWLEKIGGVPDTENLIPWTRWITPRNLPKRFTTQMYLYFLPLSRDPISSSFLVPTPDDGVEHTAALFASPQTFLSQAAAGKIILFPPQYYLMSLLTKFLPAENAGYGPLHYASQRRKIVDFLGSVPTAETEKGRGHPTARIPWAEKVMSPTSLFVRQADGRAVLGIDKPGADLQDEGRGGDWERVVLARFTKRGPVEVEVRDREEMFEEERGYQGPSGKL